MKIVLTVYLIAVPITVIWTLLESISLNSEFRRRYPEEGKKIEPFYARKTRGYYFLGEPSRIFLEEKDDKYLLARRKRIVCLTAASIIVPLGGIVVVGVIALLLQ